MLSQRELAARDLRIEELLRSSKRARGQARRQAARRRGQQVRQLTEQIAR